MNIYSKTLRAFPRMRLWMKLIVIAVITTVSNPVCAQMSAGLTRELNPNSGLVNPVLVRNNYRSTTNYCATIATPYDGEGSLYSANQGMHQLTAMSASGRPITTLPYYLIIILVVGYAVINFYRKEDEGFV